MMYKITLATLAIASIVSAQSTTSLYLFGLPAEGVVASVINHDSVATTYLISCHDESDDCYVPDSFVMTQGPSTLHINYQTMVTRKGVSATASADIGCSITNSESGICSETVAGNYGSTSISTTTTVLISNAAVELNYQAVTLSAGGTGSSVTTTATETKSGLTTKTSSTAAVTGSSAGSSGASSTSSSLSVVSTSSATSSASGLASGSASGLASSSSAGAASSSTASTAGMPKITGNAQWIMGGAAAALALAAL